MRWPSYFFRCALVGVVMSAFTGCASVEEPDHWRDAVKSNKGLIRGS